MSVEEANKIFVLGRTGSLSFEEGDKAYHCTFEKNKYKCYPVTVVSKRLSAIGLGTCYTIQKEDKTLIHGQNLVLFKSMVHAREFVKACKILDKQGRKKKLYTF